MHIIIVITACSVPCLVDKLPYLGEKWFIRRYPVITVSSANKPDDSLCMFNDLFFGMLLHLQLRNGTGFYRLWMPLFVLYELCCPGIIFTDLDNSVAITSKMYPINCIHKND